MRGNERDPGIDDGKEPAFDISTLPSLESITAETDIRLFLQKGVPAELSRAALRRAWSADPNIRDFIGIAENQYDFATGSDLPGFGTLDASADEVRRMVAEVFGELAKPPAEDQAAVSAEGETPTDMGSAEAGGGPEGRLAIQDVAARPTDSPVLDSAPEQPPDSIVQSSKVDIASQQNNPDHEYKPAPARRPHGGALPQ